MTVLTGPAADGDTWRMEQFSRAYIQAVASAAACTVSRPEIDIDSIDLILKRKTIGTAVRSPQLDVQVKATAADCVAVNEVKFPLKIKNYNELRDPDFSVPRILVVVVMPENIEQWMEHNEDGLALKKCGYWLSLQEAADTDNEHTITVSIPRTQVFDVNGLDGIFNRLADGQQP